MALHLMIENETHLPDGGPLTYTLAGTHRLDIGRDPYLEWSLPDPTLTVSGRHCEIRFHDGAYWLNDVSRNGTFVNQTSRRLQEPTRLRSGDRLYIGHYIILVQIDGEAAASPEPPQARASRGHTWASALDAPRPIDPRELMSPSGRGPRHADFSGQRIDMPEPNEPGRFPPVGGSFTQDVRSRGASAWPGTSREDVQRDGYDAWPANEKASGPSRPLDVADRTAPPATSSKDDDWSERRAREGGPSLRDEQPREEVNPWGELTFGGNTTPRPRPPAFESLAPEPDASAAPVAGAEEFVRRFAAGAGLPAETFAWRDPGDFAEELGALTRLSAESLKQLLAARTETKRIARASSHTTIQAVGNNPLKFSPTVDDALRIMFGRPTSGYLGARQAMDDAFRDAKVHQMKVFSAMQHALRLLLAELDPEEVEEALSDERSLGSLLGSRKARLWDLYSTRWAALTTAHDDGMIDAFMVFFSECYDRGT